MPKANAVYVGIDNVEEVEVVFSRKTRKEIEAIAKRAGVPLPELLARYLGNVSVAGLAGTAEAMRQQRHRSK